MAQNSSGHQGAQHKTQLLILKGVLSDLPPEKQRIVREAVAHIKEVVKGVGDLGTLTLGMAGLEIAIEEGWHDTGIA